MICAQLLFSPTLDDFGPEEPHDAPFKSISFPGLYALLDSDGKFVYIGQSLSVPYRILQHRKKNWYPQVSTRRTLELAVEEDRLIRETVLIMSCKPRANRMIKLALRKDGQLYETMWVGNKKKTRQTPKK